MTAQLDASSRRERFDQAATVLLWTLVGVLGYFGLNLALRARGTTPDYDALAYVSAAFRLHLGLTGMYLEPGTVYWPGLPFTNSLDALILALTFGIFDFHVGVWLIHSAYLVLFALLLERLLGGATALVIAAFAVTNALFLHQYTNFISEMKVGMLLVLLVAYLFHPDAARHRAALFWITVLLLMERTISLLFLGPLCIAFAGLRWLERGRRHEIVPVLLPVGLALLALAPFLWEQLPKLDSYIRVTGTRTQQNWIDMTNVHNKRELVMAYAGFLREYNGRLQLAVGAALAVSVLLLFTKARRRLLHVRDAAIAVAIVAAVLIQAATTNVQVVFWLFALEALLAGLWLRAVAPRAVTAVAAIVLFAAALTEGYRGFVAAYARTSPDAPLYRLQREMVHAMDDLQHPRVYINFGGLGPLDVRGLEIPLGRVAIWAHGDQVSYLKNLEPYLESLDSADVAFIANQNFMWPDYIGVNRHTGEISRYLERHAGEMGWIRAAHLLFDGDAARYVDVYRRAGVEVKLKWRQSGDTWLDVDTPVAIRVPGGGTMPPGYTLEVQVRVPQTGDPTFAPPWKATLEDATGKSLATTGIEAFGNNVLRFPVGGLPAGDYQLTFDRSFSSADARKLVATFLGASIVANRKP